MVANDNKSYFGYLNKLLDEYNKNFHHYKDNKRLDTDYYGLSWEIGTNPKASKFKVGDTIRITKYKNTFSKV